MGEKGKGLRIRTRMLEGRNTMEVEQKSEQDAHSEPQNELISKRPPTSRSSLGEEGDRLGSDPNSEQHNTFAREGLTHVKDPPWNS